MELDRFQVFGEQRGAAERIAPGFFPSDFEHAHLARYEWAARWCARRFVLDVACGTGYGAEVLRAVGARTVLSLDISHAALTFGVLRYRLCAARADVHDLPLPDESVDVVVSLETIEHLSKPQRFLSELHRVLRLEGTLCLSTPNRLASMGTNPYHLHEFTLDELTRMVGAVGLRPIGVWGQHWRMKPGFHHIWGIRRLAWDLARSPGIIRRWIPFADPAVWCIAAVRE